MREGYDLVIGRRYLGDAKSEDDDIVTAFGNWLFTNRQYPAWRQLHRRDSDLSCLQYVAGLGFRP